MNYLSTLKSTLDDSKVVYISSNGIVANCNTNQPIARVIEEDNLENQRFYSVPLSKDYV